MTAKNARKLPNGVVHRHACVLPKGGKYFLWVQSPNEMWMLLSGHWHSCEGATLYGENAGYQINTNKHEVLNQIEAQLELRSRGVVRNSN